METSYNQGPMDAFLCPCISCVSLIIHTPWGHLCFPILSLISDVGIILSYNLGFYSPFSNQFDYSIIAKIHELNSLNGFVIGGGISYFFSY